MSAVTLHLEHEFEVTPEEEARAVCAGAPAELEGFLEASGKQQDCPTPQEIINSSHRQLSRVMWIREAVNQILQGRNGQKPLGFWVQWGKPEGRKLVDQKDAWLVLSRPLPLEPAWGLPSGSANVRSLPFLSWTSKMDCPSWGLPSGHLAVGGTCPAAIQTVVEPAKMRPIVDSVTASEGKVSFADAVCQRCYAAKGNYDRGSTAYAQLMRLAWTREAMRTTNPETGRSMFVDTMVTVIEHSDYKMDAGPVTAEDDDGREIVTSPKEPTGERFFRIHDSGDIFEPEYLNQWKQICNRLLHIQFWAPTRIWATHWGVDAVNEINADPRNLTIRPSAFHTGSHPPKIEGPGWAGASTVIHARHNRGMIPEREKLARLKAERAPDGPDDRYTWECDAYAGKTDRTCRNAVNVDGSRGCRVCWKARGEIVNYPLH